MDSCHRREGSGTAEWNEVRLDQADLAMADSNLFIELDMAVPLQCENRKGHHRHSKSSGSQDFEFGISFPVAGHLGANDYSPADDLFYKGKLLPLHLPPRLQMVQNIEQTDDPRNNSGFTFSCRYQGSAGVVVHYSSLGYESSGEKDSGEVSSPDSSEAYSTCTGLSKRICLCRQYPSSKMKPASSSSSKWSVWKKNTKRSVSSKDQIHGCDHFCHICDSERNGSAKDFGSKNNFPGLLDEQKYKSSDLKGLESVSCEDEDVQQRKSKARAFLQGIFKPLKLQGLRKNAGGSVMDSSGQSADRLQRRSRSAIDLKIPARFSTQGIVMRAPSNNMPDVQSSIQGAIAYCKQTQEAESDESKLQKRQG